MIGLAGGDLSVPQAEFTSLFQKLGLTTTEIAQFTDSVRSLTDTLVPNPDPMQSTNVATELENFVKAMEKLITSQPGLANFLTDTDILFDPRFANLGLRYSAFVLGANALKLTPGLAYDAVANISPMSKTEAAQFITILNEASKNAVAKKALSKFSFTRHKIGC